ncbi:MAG: cell division ATP-binding protein FtsE [Candidatus Nealsonbacteria bacterium]|nr:cell division ATP-binding protein FtsE [Candidatus Nealsonbacteria bacterium]
MIKFQDVSKIYPANHLEKNQVVALKDVSFEIKDGEFILVAGKSGAGKTTLIRLLIGEEKPTKGRVFFGDLEVHKIKRGHLSQLRRRLGVVFQDYKLLPKKTVSENIAYALEVTGASEEQIKSEVPKVLKIVGLEHCVQHFPSELSGGEKQRVSIARALIHRPEAILADEPTGNLDPYHTWDVIKLLVKINQLGTTVILATHDQEIINNLEKRVISLEKGRIIGDKEKGKFII